MEERNKEGDKGKLGYHTSQRIRQPNRKQSLSQQPVHMQRVGGDFGVN